MKTLRYGDSGADVKVLQSLLQSQGFFNGSIGGNFLAKTKAAVIAFQQSHKGPKGEWLEPDGVVGKDTWWALENPDKEEKRDDVVADVIPSGLSDIRKKLLKAALGEYNKNVKEVPDGSNWGPEIKKYLEGVGPCAWCCYFVSWLIKQVTGKYPLNKRHGHCLTFWREAKTEGKTFYKDKYTPVPGDLFVMLYKNSRGQLTGSGHIGVVFSVAKDGKSFNTIEGNAGNRVKFGVRQMSQGTLVGFINLFGDDSKNYERKLLNASSVSDSLASTR